MNRFMTRQHLLLSVLAAGLLLPRFAAAADASTEGLEKIARPFFEQHCTKCHGEKKKKGDLRVDNLVINFDNPKIMGTWEEIMNRVNSGDMPPEDNARPKPDDIAKLSEWITAQLLEAETSHQATADRVTFHKLSREEYANTIKDLLGVTYDVTDPTGLPEDPDWHGFQRIGSVLTLSPAHVEKYLAAAETVLGEALSLGKQPNKEVIRWNPIELRNWHQFEKEYKARGVADKLRVDLVPNNGALDGRDLNLKVGGEYICRVKLSGLRPAGGRAPRLRLYAGDISRVLFEQDIEAPEDKPITIEFRTHLPPGEHPIRIVNAVPGPNPEDRRSRASETPNAFTNLQGRVPWQMKFTDDDGKPIVPFLLLDYIEWEGPIVDAWPTAAHQKIFFGGEKAEKTPAYGRDIATRFAERAWRRPITPAESERFGKLFESAQKFDPNFDTSVKTVLLSILCSKSFVYLEEGNLNAMAPKLTDWELASRLSYFLWSTMPDQVLLDLAKANKLHETEVLRAQVRRMLADPRAAEFAETFPHQWLQLRKVGMFAPDKKLYPDYDEALEKSMIAESTSFFREVLAKNLSVREFLSSDWTMLNERLASHYEISGVSGDAMQRVALKSDYHRGGLLTQGAILSLTSDGTRHRPVHRGVWLLESIIGKPPPPPPANVPALGTPSPKEKKTTVREKLESHRSDANCNGCHRRIDPLGLAFDNYDAIGRWRTTETIKDGIGDDPKIDSSGELYDGRTFTNADGLKKLLLDDTDRFAASLTDKLATYALRRGMNFSDHAELKQVTAKAKPDGYKLATMIELLVTNPLFQKR
jgi:mono/diheme cytochrome c family protein